MRAPADPHKVPNWKIVQKHAKLIDTICVEQLLCNLSNAEKLVLHDKAVDSADIILAELLVEE
jgi:hypothetical protein